MLKESEMLNQEKILGLQQAQEMKTRGNEFFGQKNYKVEKALTSVSKLCLLFL